MRTGCIISDKSIRVVRIKGNKPVLFRVLLEPGIITEGVISDGAKLKSALGKLSLSKEEVVLGLPEKHILGKSIMVSDHGSDLEAQVSEELSSYAPSGQSYTDWQVLETGVDYQKIFVASVTATLLDSYIAVFEALSIRVAAVEPITFALSRHLPKATQACLVVALEESEILLSIVNENGGVELTSVLPIATQKDDLLSEISIMRSFYDKKTKGTKVGKILLTGETATEELKNQIGTTGTPCDLLRLEGRTVPEKEKLSFFSVAALCDLPVVFPKNHEHINLLPVEILVSQQNERKSSSFGNILSRGAIFFGVLCFLYAAMIGFLFWQQFSFGNDITTIREAIQGSSSSKIRSEVSLVNKYIAIAKKVSQNDPKRILNTLSFLAEKSGNGITITNYVFDVATNTVLLTGQSIERDRLIGFGQILETEGKFVNVKIPLTSLEKKGASTFALSFEVPK